MSPVLKRVLLLVGAKKAFDALQEARRPRKRSVWSRLARPAAIIAGGSAVAYLGVSGRLQDIVDQVKRLASGSAPEPPTATTTSGWTDPSSAGAAAEAAPTTSAAPVGAQPTTTHEAPSSPEEPVVPPEPPPATPTS